MLHRRVPRGRLRQQPEPRLLVLRQLQAVCGGSTAAAAAAAAAAPTSSAASRACGKTAEQLAATIAGVQSACSSYAFVAPPQQASCPGRARSGGICDDGPGEGCAPATACAAALAEVLDGPCALQLQASAPAGLVHTTQQLCRGACADDVQRLSLKYEETCGTTGCDAECAAVLREIGGHACHAGGGGAQRHNAPR